MSTSVKWIREDNYPEDHENVLVLLKDHTVRYGYHGIKGWWIYSENNGFIITLEATHWKPLQ